MENNAKSKGFNAVHSQIISQLIADVLALFFSYFIQYYLRFESGMVHSPTKPDFVVILTTGTVLLGYWLLLFFFSGMYKNWHLRSPFEEYGAVIKVGSIGCAFLVFFILFDSSSSPRMLFLIYFIVLTISVIIGRTVSRRIQVKLRDRRIVVIDSIIIGSPKKALEFFKKTEKSPSWGFKVNGIVLVKENTFDELNELANKENISVRYLGCVDDLNDILIEHKPEEVIISTESPKHKTMLDIVSKCSDNNVKVNIEPDLYDIFTGQTRAQNIYGIPLIEIRTQLLKPWQEVIKRIFDIVFSSIVLILGMPVWLIVAIIIKLESPGNVFYTQPRVGRNGKVFKIYKFRSMRNDVKPKSQSWTVVNDPRVTTFGKFIRKSHIDEIPQFWNVFIGEMSVVGPRPEQPKFVEEFNKELPHYKRRLIVRPGITGWWQVKYTSYEMSIEEIENRLKDDFYYIENMSITLDIEIVVRTVWCVFKGHGQA